MLSTSEESAEHVKVDALKYAPTASLLCCEKRRSVTRSLPNPCTVCAVQSGVHTKTGEVSSGTSTSTLEALRVSRAT